MCAVTERPCTELDSDQMSFVRRRRRCWFAVFLGPRESIVVTAQIGTNTHRHELSVCGHAGKKLSARSSLFVFTINNEDKRLCVVKVVGAIRSRVNSAYEIIFKYEYTNIWGTTRASFENNISVGGWQTLLLVYTYIPAMANEYNIMLLSHILPVEFECF